MRPFLMPLILSIVTSVVSCSSIPQVNIAEDKYQISEITLERSGSWGVREGYKVVLCSDGTAVYHGDIHAKRRGKYRGRVQGEQFAGLAKLIARNEYFSLKDKYHNPSVADGYTITTSVVYAGGRKTIEDYEEGGGEQLSEIERAIMAVAGQIAWEKDAS